MTRVKICGITNSDDACAAIEAGADALGFIFVPGTPRCVSGRPGLIELLCGIPPFVGRIGVCAEPGQLAAAAVARLTGVQVYSAEWQQDPPPGRDVILACRMRDASSLDAIGCALGSCLAPVTAIHLDTYRDDKLGGSGVAFDWTLATEAKRRFGLPIILAGGLTPDNVEEAVATVRPYAVDVSSGVEAEPGRKDHAKVRDFIQAVRRADAWPTAR